MSPQKIEVLPIEADHTHTEFSELRGLLETVLKEVHALRREQLPATEEQIRIMLSAIYQNFEEDPWTAAMLLEDALQVPSLLRPILSFIGAKPTVQRMSRYLRKSTGRYGEFELHLIDPHSRYGMTFSVRNVSKSVTPHID